MADLRIGMIGLDTSHVSAFAALLNDPQNPSHVPGGKVTVAFPGGSPDFDLSIGRVGKFTDELRDQRGVKIVDSAEAVAEQCDLLFINAVDGRTHRGYMEKTARYKRPTFIDKPIAVTGSDTEAIFKLAEEHGIPLMSCSSLRYSDSFVAALQPRKAKLVGIDVYGPMAEQPTQPGLFWYGIHTVEMIVAAMGVGAKEVRATTNKDCDVVTIEYTDGRMAALRGLRVGSSGFGAVLHADDGATWVDAYKTNEPPYASMLKAILGSLPHGRSDVPKEETIEVVDIIEAANASRKAHGQVVRLLVD
jgi:predicted dehydrogenase